MRPKEGIFDASRCEIDASACYGAALDEGLDPSFSALTRRVSKVPSGCFTAIVTAAAPVLSSVLLQKPTKSRSGGLGS